MRKGKNEVSPKEVSKKKKKRSVHNPNPQIVMISYGFTFLFLAMMFYIAYFVQVDAKQVINNPYNKRQEILEERVLRGRIYSQDGKVLAKSKEGEDGKQRRIYPYENMFCHVVGRTEHSYTGVELSQCYPMLTSSTNGLVQIWDQIQGKKAKGDHVYTSLQYELQKVAYESLGARKGAIVAMEPATGKILAMVSKPDYDPNTVGQNWENLTQDEEGESALVNRATQGLYPPGSTFKILTTLAYLKENPKGDFTYQCGGAYTGGSNTIRCFGGEVHGMVNLETAFAESCNGAFASMGQSLNRTTLRKLCGKFGFNKLLPVDFEHNPSSFVLHKNDPVEKVTHTSIGQGETLLSPLHNAMITATIANGGVMMKPYVVDRVQNDNGKVVRRYTPVSLGRVVPKKHAAKLRKLMKRVVTDGTARGLYTGDYQAAGKTGTAEYNAAGDSHAWFVGYAPAKNPKIVVSIIVEGAGTGSAYAVPIAKKMFDAYLK